MKSKWSLAVLLASGVGLLGGAASAQNSLSGNGARAGVEYRTYGPGQSAALQLADWDDHRRCDGDHDRDDRGCYQRYYNRNRYYGYSYYGNGYYAPNYYDRNGWYDRNGRWHAYDRDRDRDRRRHHGDDDDRR
jgi:hypothetical protein